VLLRYMGLPLAIVVVGAAGMALTDGVSQTLTGLPLGAFLAALALALIGGLWFLMRFERHWRYRHNLLDPTDSIAARGLWIRPTHGMRRVLERGRLALELAGSGEAPCLLVSLLPGQRLPHFSAVREVAITTGSGRAHGLVVLQPEGTPSLIGYAQLFGPYRLTEPDVLRCARNVVRRDIVVCASLWWPLIKRHRDFRHILSRGSSSVAAEVVGTTQPKWYERIEGRDTLWLQLDGSGSPRYVSMRLLGRQDGTTLSPGEAVTLYGPGDGSGSVIAVGSQRRTTLLGVGQPWSAPEPAAE
jgi:hypothetical protein